MYTPKHFEQKDLERLLSFMRDFNFAILVSTKEHKPIATHLPFVIEDREDGLYLLAHLSRANEQWKFFGEEVLVIFSEPHAYISPALYEKTDNVPTWNYISVHAYGKLSIIGEPDKQYDLLEKQMQAFDPAYLDQWKIVSPEYKEGLRKGIVAFEIAVTDLQGKEKLSQNKTAADRENVRQHLENSDDPGKKYLADKMK
jgi:transcriptional regulator